jgi:hypothetical protein
MILGARFVGPFLGSLRGKGGGHVCQQLSRRDCANDKLSGATAAVAADHSITPRIRL